MAIFIAATEPFTDCLGGLDSELMEESWVLSQKKGEMDASTNQKRIGGCHQ